MLLEMLFNEYFAIAILPLFRENSNKAKLGRFDDLIMLRENSKQKARQLTNVPSSAILVHLFKGRVSRDFRPLIFFINQTYLLP
jgi:hypothetical protein